MTIMVILTNRRLQMTHSPAWTVAEARQVHRAAYAHWTEEDETRLAAEFAAGRTAACTCGML